MEIAADGIEICGTVYVPQFLVYTDIQKDNGAKAGNAKAYAENIDNRYGICKL